MRVLAPDQAFVITGGVEIFEHGRVRHGDSEHAPGIVPHDRTGALPIRLPDQFVEDAGSEQHRVAAPRLFHGVSIYGVPPDGLDVQ